MVAHLRERPQLSYPYAQHRFYLRLTKHTGALIFWQQRSYTVTGTLQECEAAYRDAQIHNLAAGWWSLLSVVLMNWIALFSNVGAINKVRRLAREDQPGAVQPAVPGARQAPPQGWYPDPSGPGDRYWDGAAWTHWTNPPGHG